MNYVRIDPFDTANGIRIGVVVWVTGCSHHCEGCHNPQTWNPKFGKIWTKEAEDKLIQIASNPVISRITFSGGDPMYLGNRADILRLVKKLKVDLPNKEIWLYTGYNWENIKDLEILKYIDVLVDGKFHIEEKDISLPFCGSKNQRVICVPQTIKSGKIILWKPSLIESI